MILYRCVGLLQLGNHDQHRVASRFPPALVDGMNIIGQLLPGISVTYNGDEIGMENTIINWDQVIDPQGLNAGECCYLEATRDLQRTPFQWDTSINAGKHVQQSALGPFMLELIVRRCAPYFA
jgi:alpha-glucosidase